MNLKGVLLTDVIGFILLEINCILSAWVVYCDVIKVILQFQRLMPFSLLLKQMFADNAQLYLIIYFTNYYVKCFNYLLYMYITYNWYLEL